MEYIAVLVDVINSDILHGTAGIVATPELGGDIDCSNSRLYRCNSYY